MKKAFVLPANGIGDALLMMIASKNLLDADYSVTTFYPLLQELSSWFHKQVFQKLPLDEPSLLAILQSADLFIIQNDNSERVKRILSLRQENKLKNIAIFYPTYSKQKHGPLQSLDRVFNEKFSMAENISRCIASLLNQELCSKENGLTPPFSLIHKKHTKRIAIHPTSKEEQKNWPREKYFKLAAILAKKGFEVSFIISPIERSSWVDALEKGFALPHFANLSQLASFVFESGFVIGNDSLIGHLASNLQIPTLIIANDEKRMQLWRPGWLEGEVLTPLKILQKINFLKIRQKHWKRVISPRQVSRRFQKLCRSF